MPVEPKIRDLLTNPAFKAFCSPTRITCYDATNNAPFMSIWMKSSQQPLIIVSIIKQNLARILRIRPSPLPLTKRIDGKRSRVKLIERSYVYILRECGDDYPLQRNTAPECLVYALESRSTFFPFFLFALIH